MSRRPFTVVRSRAVALPQENVDTDQIVPARFLTTTRRDGLAAALFADWRFAADGAPRADSPFDDRGEAGQGAGGREILVAGANFGCGSSREHAVWALAEHGFRVVVAPRLADIFRRNALQNGLLAVEIPAGAHAALSIAVGADAEVEVDLAASAVRWPGGSASFGIEPFARLRLLRGMDDLDYLLAQAPAIARYEAEGGR
jgi:3-isopropylmalate/(R)-2-methylmalate dehydratase small subunit